MKVPYIKKELLMLYYQKKYTVTTFLHIGQDLINHTKLYNQGNTLEKEDLEEKK